MPYVPLSRSRFAGLRFLAVHTTTPHNPRELLTYEAAGKKPTSVDALQLPQGHSRYVCTRVVNPTLETCFDPQRWSQSVALALS